MFPTDLRNIEPIFKCFCERNNSRSLSYFTKKVLSYRTQFTNKNIVIQNKTYLFGNLSGIASYENGNDDFSMDLERERRKLEHNSIVDSFELELIETCDEYVYDKLVEINNENMCLIALSMSHRFDFFQYPAPQKIIWTPTYSDMELDLMYDIKDDICDDDILDLIRVHDPEYFESIMVFSKRTSKYDMSDYDESFVCCILSPEEYLEECAESYAYNDVDSDKEFYYEDFETVTLQIVPDDSISEFYSIFRKIGFNTIYEFARTTNLLQLSFKNIQTDDLTTQIEFQDDPTCQSVFMKLDTFIILNKSQLARSYFTEFNSLPTIKIPEPCNKNVRTTLHQLLNDIRLQNTTLTGDEFNTLLKICEYLDVQFDFTFQTYTTNLNSQMRSLNTIY